MRLLLLVAVIAAWMSRNISTDPREWPAGLKRECDRLRADGAESVAAGKRAAARRAEQVQREIDEASLPRPR